jgi:hypothetical protein
MKIFSVMVEVFSLRVNKISGKKAVIVKNPDILLTISATWLVLWEKNFTL